MKIIVGPKHLVKQSSDKKESDLQIGDLRIPRHILEIADKVVYQNGEFSKILKDRHPVHTDSLEQC